MLIAKAVEKFARELVVLTFDFLKTDDIRIIGFDELLDKRRAQPNRINIPGNKTHKKLPEAFLYCCF